MRCIYCAIGRHEACVVDAGLSKGLPCDCRPHVARLKRKKKVVRRKRRVA